MKIYKLFVRREQLKPRARVDHLEFVKSLHVFRVFVDFHGLLPSVLQDVLLYLLGLFGLLGLVSKWVRSFGVFVC